MVRLVEPPVEGVVTLAEVKDHLRITGTAEDTYLTAILAAATEVAEQITRRQLAPATFELHLDRFPAGPIDLPLPPLQSVESVTYTDPDGVEQTFAEFEADTVGGSVAPAYGVYWPATRAVPNAVRVRFKAGYLAGECPFSIRAAILLLVGALYENREAYHTGKLVENEAVGLLLWPYRVWQ